MRRRRAARPQRSEGTGGEHSGRRPPSNRERKLLTARACVVTVRAGGGSGASCAVRVCQLGLAEPPTPKKVSSSKPANVRFYFDADVLGLAHVIARLRPDATYPGDPGAVVKKRRRPPCPMTSPAVLDHIWIPQVAAFNWLIITRDSHVQDHRAEIAAVRDNGARMIALAGGEARSTFEQLEVLMTQWHRIQQRLNEDGSFVYGVARTSFRPVGLSS